MVKTGTISDKKASEQSSESLLNDPDSHLYNNHMFHHLLGLSNLRKVMKPKANELNLTGFSPDRFAGEDDESFI